MKDAVTVWYLVRGILVTLAALATLAVGAALGYTYRGEVNEFCLQITRGSTDEETALCERNPHLCHEANRDNESEVVISGPNEEDK